MAYEARPRRQDAKDDNEDKKSHLQLETPKKAKPYVAVRDDTTDSSVEKQRSRSKSIEAPLSATSKARDVSSTEIDGARSSISSNT